MGISATRTQKAKVAELTIDGVADQRAGRPGRLHVVVVPGLTPIETQPSRLVDQNVMVKAIPGGMSKDRQSAGGMNGLDHRLGTQRFSNDGITAVVRLKCWVVQLKAEGQHMHKASLQQSTDFHPAPDHGTHSTGAALLI